MSEKSFIAIIAFIGLIIIVSNFKPEYKYQLHNYSGVPILLDRENGLIWKYENNSMQYMNYKGAIVPDGEQKRRDVQFEEIVKKNK
jgi:hypothetical protein